MVPYLMKIASLPRFMTHVGLKSSFSSIICKINIPKELTLPILFEVHNINDRISDLEIYVSMNTKTPSPQDHDKKVCHQVSTPGKIFRFSFGEAAPEFT